MAYLLSQKDPHGYVHFNRLTCKAGCLQIQYIDLKRGECSCSPARAPTDNEHYSSSDKTTNVLDGSLLSLPPGQVQM